MGTPAALHEAWQKSAFVKDLVDRHTEALFGHAIQSVACNALRISVEARFCRWLLTCHDSDLHRHGRADPGVLFADMLGVQRTTVTAVARALQAKGAIRYRRGVVDHHGSRHAPSSPPANDYGVIRRTYERLLPEGEIFLSPAKTRGKGQGEGRHVQACSAGCEPEGPLALSIRSGREVPAGHTLPSPRRRGEEPLRSINFPRLLAPDAGMNLPIPCSASRETPMIPVRRNILLAAAAVAALSAGGVGEGLVRDQRDRGQDGDGRAAGAPPPTSSRRSTGPGASTSPAWTRR